MICTPTIDRISVVFPHPLGPSRAVTDPGSTLRERSGRTRFSPRRTRSPEISIDFYRATRAGNVRLWSSPVLAAGTHTFRLRVTGTKNAIGHRGGYFSDYCGDR